MTENFSRLIKEAKLTKKERLLADYILNNFQKTCFMTSTELAEALSMSHSSVIRFTKDLGFKGYTQFQQSIRAQYNDYISKHADANAIPLVKLEKSLDKLSQESIVSSLQEITNNNILSAIMHNPESALDDASSAIIHAENKYIIGYRGCDCIASFLSVILKDTLPGVHSKGSGEVNPFDYLSDVGKKDCVIIVSYPRYSKLSKLAAEMAYKEGASVILLTDTPTAPIAKYATHLLTCNVDSLCFFNSQVPVLFLAELLCTYISKKVGKGNEEKLRLIDYYTSEIGLY